VNEVRKLLSVLVLAAVAALVVALLPDIKRYIEISRM
jgi:hypothetical protein